MYRRLSGGGCLGIFKGHLQGTDSTIWVTQTGERWESTPDNTHRQLPPWHLELGSRGIADTYKIGD